MRPTPATVDTRGTVIVRYDGSRRTRARVLAGWDAASRAGRAIEIRLVLDRRTTWALAFGDAYAGVESMRAELQAQLRDQAFDLAAGCATERPLSWSVSWGSR